MQINSAITNYTPTVTILNTATANGALAGLRLLPNNGTTGFYLGIHDSGVEGNVAFINQEKNAPLALFTNSAERMRITSGGNVGIGTSSPAMSLQIGNGTGTGNQYLRLFNSASDMYIGQTASNLFGAGNGQVIVTDGTYTSNFAIGTLNASANLIFGTNNIERARITSGGVFMVGTTTALGGGGSEATNGLNINSSGVLINNSTNDANAYFAKRSGYSSSTFVAFYVAGTYVGAINTNGSSTFYTTASDYRLKQDLKEYNGLDLISKIKTYDYQWKSDNTRSFGVIAHELQEIIPQAVNGEKDGKDMQGVDYSKLVPILVKAIQELKQEIEILKNK